MSGIDIKLTQTDGDFDLTITDGDFTGVDGFDTAIDVSLFTDARAPEDRVTKPENRRGYLGDTESPVEGRSLGGLLWLVEQRRLTQETLNEVVSFANQALAWFVEDGIAKNVDVTGAIEAPHGMSLTIIITTLDGRTDTHYVPLWEVTGNAA
jgi:phage gp46-like protein